MATRDDGAYEVELIGYAIEYITTSVSNPHSSFNIGEILEYKIVTESSVFRCQNHVHHPYSPQEACCGVDVAVKMSAQLAWNASSLVLVQGTFCLGKLPIVGTLALMSKSKVTNQGVVKQSHSN